MSYQGKRDRPKPRIPDTRVPDKRTPNKYPFGPRNVPKAKISEVVRQVLGHRIIPGNSPSTVPPTITVPQNAHRRMGIVVDHGPNGPDEDPDYEDNRYWIALSAPTNASDDVTEALDVEIITHQSVKFIFTATNMTESVTKTHRVPMGTVVTLLQAHDRFSNARPYFYSGNETTLQQFVVMSFGDDGDTLNCSTWDGESFGEEDITVLLPHELRQSRYNGKAEELFDAASGSYVTVRYVAGASLLTRTAFIDAQSYSEQQIITPQYVTAAHGGSIGPTIVTAVSRASVAGGLGQPPDTPEESRREWMVQDARAWAEVFTQQTGAGIVQRMIERRGGGERA